MFENSGENLRLESSYIIKISKIIEMAHRMLKNQVFIG
jgi:hypothetical protein